jgi:hypothetical protein
MSIEIEINKRFAYLNLEVGSWKRYYELNDNYSTAQNVVGIYCYFRIEIPSFNPDKAHINWVKEAWGMMPPKPVVAESQDNDELEYDPLPF